MRKNILYLFLFILFVSCESKRSSINILESFKETKYIKVDKIYDDIFIGSPYHLFMKGNLLFTLESRQEKSIRCVDVKNQKEIAFFIDKGRGPGELLHALMIDSYGTDSIFVFGRDPQQFQFFSLKDIKNGKKKSKHIKIVSDSIRVLPYGIMLSERYALFHAFSPQHELERYCIYDLLKDTYSFFGGYPIEAFANVKLNASAKVTLFQPELAMRHKDGLVAASMGNFAAMEIIDPFHKEIIAAKYYDFPQFERKKVNNLGTITMADNEQKTGFLYLNSTDSLIYCLYPDKFNGDPDYYIGDNIVAYDWELNPVIHYKLEHEISGFTVTPDDKYIYAILSGGDEPKLIRYEL